MESSDSSAQYVPEDHDSLISFLIGLTLIGAIVAVVYYVHASQLLTSFGSCGPGAGPGGGLGQEGNWTGAGYESGGVGAAIGGVLWIAAVLTAWRLRDHRGAVMIAYAVLYVTALVVLWYAVSPAIWGAKHCTA